MENVDTLFKQAVEEIERMLNTKTVVGEPLKIGDNTIIPLVSVGFGFAAGGGSGKAPATGEGAGGGTGGGGGVKPVAVLIINQDGVRLEPIKSGTATVLEKVAETVAKAGAKKMIEES
jgi:uncharacterized spore protein YtfJ